MPDEGSRGRACTATTERAARSTAEARSFESESNACIGILPFESAEALRSRVEATMHPGRSTGIARMARATRTPRGTVISRGRGPPAGPPPASSAGAEADAGVIPTQAVQIIATACTDLSPAPEALAREGKRSGSLAVPLVKALTEHVAREDARAAAFVHTDRRARTSSTPRSSCASCRAWPMPTACSRRR
jgi:hypothetical protein